MQDQSPDLCDCKAHALYTDCLLMWKWNWVLSPTPEKDESVNTYHCFFLLFEIFLN